MGFLDKILGGAAAAPIESIGKIIDDIHTSKEEKLDAETTLYKIGAKLQGLQAEITKTEAQHRTLFVSGWRPSVGWLCTFGLFVNYVLAPIVSPWVSLQVADSDTLLTLVLAMSGIAGLRTVEKARGLTR